MEIAKLIRTLGTAVLIGLVVTLLYFVGPPALLERGLESRGAARNTPYSTTF